MKKRQWDGKTKAKIVLEGLSGRSVAELCNEYQINQGQYYQWRDKFLSGAHRAFDLESAGATEKRLRAKVSQLKQIIGALTVELKKSEDEL